MRMRKLTFIVILATFLVAARLWTSYSIEHTNSKGPSMKKVMILLVAVVVVVLPHMARGQEPSDNGTVPPYKVWVPVVRGGGTCEYDVMRIRYNPGYSGGNHPWPPKLEAWIGVDGSELPRLEEPVADVLHVEVQSGLNPDQLPNQELKVLRWRSANSTIGWCSNTYCYYGGGFTVDGTVYARGRVVCAGEVYGEWSPVYVAYDWQRDR